MLVLILMVHVVLPLQELHDKKHKTLTLWQLMRYLFNINNEIMKINCYVANLIYIKWDLIQWIANCFTVIVAAVCIKMIRRNMSTFSPSFALLFVKFFLVYIYIQLYNIELYMLYIYIYIYIYIYWEVFFIYSSNNCIWRKATLWVSKKRSSLSIESKEMVTKVDFWYSLSIKRI